MRVSVDVGGTFTDVIVLDEDSGALRLEKVETVPADPASGVLAGFDKARAPLQEVDFFVHGTTLGINALLTRGGARVAIVTTAGFRDVYELGRTDPEPMYDFTYVITIDMGGSTSTRSALEAAASLGSTTAVTYRSGRRALALFPARRAPGRAESIRRSPTRRLPSATSIPATSSVER